MSTLGVENIAVNKTNKKGDIVVEEIQDRYN